MAVTWTAELDAEFRQMRLGPDKKSVQEMAEHFGTTVGAIYAHARIINALVEKHIPWTSEQVRRLVELDDQGMPYADIAAEVEHSVGSVLDKLRALGRNGKRKKDWSADLVRLRELAEQEEVLDGDAVARIAKALDRSDNQRVRDKLREIGFQPRLKVRRPKASKVQKMPKTPLPQKVDDLLDEAAILEEVRALNGIAGRLGAIARKHAVSVRKLRAVCKAAGIDLPVGHSRRPKQDMPAVLRAAAADGLTITQAARRAGSDVRTAGRVAKEEGIVFAVFDRAVAGRLGGEAKARANPRLPKVPMERKLSEVKTKLLAPPHAVAPKMMASQQPSTPESLRAQPTLMLAEAEVKVQARSLAPVGHRVLSIEEAMRRLASRWAETV